MTQHPPSVRPLKEIKADSSRAGSGQHPAVKTYRAKLESIDRGASAAAEELDKMLQEFLRDLKTPVPDGPPEPEKGS